MTEDERAIRELVATWMEASKNGDTATVLSLITDDALFMVPGAPPFGKEAFARASESMSQVRLDGASTIEELQVLGDWAFLRNFIRITATPPDAGPVSRSGFTLTLLRRDSDGKWRVARDANLLTLDRPTV